MPHHRPTAAVKKRPKRTAAQFHPAARRRRCRRNLKPRKPEPYLAEYLALEARCECDERTIGRANHHHATEPTVGGQAATYRQSTAKRRGRDGQDGPAEQIVRCLQVLSVGCSVRDGSLVQVPRRPNACIRPRLPDALPATHQRLRPSRALLGGASADPIPAYSHSSSAPAAAADFCVVAVAGGAQRLSRASGRFRISSWMSCQRS